MRLLIITNNPERASFRQRVGVHLDMLASHGIETEVAVLPKGFLARHRVFRRSTAFDAVLLHKKRLNPRDAFFLRRYARRIGYDFDDAVMYAPRAPDRDSRSHLLPFRRTVRLADLVIAGNAYLGEHARVYNPNVRVLPTGLDTEVYNSQTRPTPDGKVRLVWIGARATLPYLQQIGPSIEQVGGRFRNVVLRIICDTFLEMHHLPVERRPWSMHGQIADLVSGDIGLSPLPDDRFTRGKCAFKILQYAAAGLPIVASPVGVNAQYVQDGITGFHAMTRSDWVEKMILLIQDEQLRTKMGQAAKAWVADFDSKRVGERLVRILKEDMTSADA